MSAELQAKYQYSNIDPKTDMSGIDQPSLSARFLYHHRSLVLRTFLVHPASTTAVYFGAKILKSCRCATAEQKHKTPILRNQLVSVVVEKATGSVSFQKTRQAGLLSTD